MFTKWWTSKSKEEAELLENAYDYEEEYFSDMRLIDYKDELFAVKILDRILTPDETLQFNDENLEIKESEYCDSYDAEDILNRLICFKKVDT